MKYLFQEEKMTKKQMIARMKAEEDLIAAQLRLIDALRYKIDALETLVKVLKEQQEKERTDGNV